MTKWLRGSDDIEAEAAVIQLAETLIRLRLYVTPEQER